MHRPRKFLILIIVLLVINVLFFSIWYPLGGRDFVRNYIASMIGKAANASIKIGNLHISDKQILVQDFNIATQDSLIDLKIDSVRLRYNLYKFILSGFKLNNVVSSVEIVKPVGRLYYHPISKAEKKKAKKERFKIPDLVPYFKLITLEDGALEADLAFDLKILHTGKLSIEENLTHLDLRIENTSYTDVLLSANTSLGGSIHLKGSLDNGRIALAEAEIADFKPLYVSHPDIRDFRSDININANYSEPADSGAVQFGGKAIIWNTAAEVIDKFAVQIPLINLETDGHDAALSISRSSIGRSSLVADLLVQDYLGDMTFDGSRASISLDASDILPQMNGLIEADLCASGSIKDPSAEISARSHRFAYQEWVFEDLSLVADYQDDRASLSTLDARWKNQALSISGSFVPQTLSFDAELATNALKDIPGDIVANGRLNLSGVILKPYPLLSANLKDVNVVWRHLNLRNLNAEASMVPSEGSLLVSADIQSEEGYSIRAVGDVLSQHIALDAVFDSLEAASVYDLDVLGILAPQVSGQLKAVMTGRDIWYHANLASALKGEYDYIADIDLLGNVNVAEPAVMASLKTSNGYFNGLPADISVNMDYRDMKLKLWSLKLEDMLNLSAMVDLKDLWLSDVDLSIRNIDSAKIISYYPDISHLIPEFNKLNLFATYNKDSQKSIDAWVNLTDVDLISVIPLSVDMHLKGSPDLLSLSGDISHKKKTLIDLAGTASLHPKLNVALGANIDDLKLQEVLTQSPGLASVSGTVDFSMQDILSEDSVMEIAADLVGRDMKFGDIEVDYAAVKAAQESNALVIDSLYVFAHDLLTASASGSLDYNILQNEFYEGDRLLNIQVDGELFPWLKKLTDYILVSSGDSSLELSIGTSEDQFMFHSGHINLSNGLVHLKDQVEPMRDIQIQGVFEQNRLMIQRGTFQMGNGKFYMNNLFESEPSDHFMVSFLDLGYFRVLIEEPGIQATIPVVSPPKTLSNVAISGQDGRYAVIRGPFDDMKIEALVTASNLDILYPPGADNLLNLIMSVRSTGKKPDTEPTPLPFKLDVRINIGENVRYVTYPTNLYLSPGGFLHLIYNGNRFIVEEANINSERGSIDFFGTVFQVENIAITMIDQQNILSVNGLFNKRTPDGSIITLSVASSPEYDKGFFDRLQISLSSDNPQDQNITQVLSRMRYNQGMEELPEDQKQNLLQDEALGLIGGNLNSTVLTPFFYPVENWFRRTLKLDGFSINAGFIQNIFSEYSANPSQLADMTDLSNLSSDITRFSSSILLNNLSVSMSKYLGYRVFADYELQLQEATDMQQKTRILVSHDTSLRLVLPRQFRLGYTLNYSPKDTGLTHEILLQKSWRFWGL
ncbi:MAG: hypothetical protein PHQ78_02770 [Candidatus Cloacimonetes bacterium]|jgi:hypothetical protein|nr:translocation/assembly module TamB [Candidatus Cloacimonadota bacterium]MDD2506223.1 hypothetical protein [Candidatus Cloacimonadota bacterium]MDD4559624.1 hypothetical protein [Candidatus Cloacimonadota bacterium]